MANLNLPTQYQIFKTTIRALLLALTVSACSSTGIKVDEAAMAQFQKGKTTCAEIMARLGKPTHQMARDNGDVVIAYGYASSQAHPENFIPIVGAFVRGYDTEQTAAIFKCNSVGTLIKTEYISGGQGTGMNVEALSQFRKDARKAE